MGLTCRWFPAILALLQWVRHLAFVGYSYWAAAQNERIDLEKFVRQDLARPLFEPYGWCGAWIHYDSAITALLGLDWPAYLAAVLVHEVINLQSTCVDAIMTPRGQIISASFVPAIWFLVGLSFRRLTQGRWHRPAVGRVSRFIFWLGIALFPLGVVALPGSLLALGVSGIGAALRMAGFGFWLLFISALCAERLRIWPFHRLAPAKVRDSIVPSG